MKKPDYVHTVKEADIGKNYFIPNLAVSRKFPDLSGRMDRGVSVVDLCGYFQRHDCGKRIYRVYNEDYPEQWVLQMESDDQKAERNRRFEETFCHPTRI